MILGSKFRIFVTKNRAFQFKAVANSRDLVDRLRVGYGISAIPI